MRNRVLVIFYLHQKNYVAILRLAGPYVGFFDPVAILKKSQTFDLKLTFA